MTMPATLPLSIECSLCGEEIGEASDYFGFRHAVEEGLWYCHQCYIDHIQDPEDGPTLKEFLQESR